MEAANMTVPAAVGPVEIALAWVHRPTGAAVVQGVVRHPDGGPIITGSRLRSRPVGAGGVEVLDVGAEPTAVTERRPLQPHEWAVTGTDNVEAELTRRGWRTISRAEAASVLTEQGYQMRPSAAPGHILHSDHADDKTWHDWIGVNGRSFDYIQAVFVVRPLSLLVDTTAASEASVEDGGGSVDTSSGALHGRLTEALDNLVRDLVPETCAP